MDTVVINEDVAGALLSCAVQGPNWRWLQQTQLNNVWDPFPSKALTRAALESAGLPPALSGSWNKVRSYISQLHKSKAAGLKSLRRGTLVIIGYQGAGKSSLMWRLQNPTGNMPELDSTDGLDIGKHFSVASAVVEPHPTS